MKPLPHFFYSNRAYRGAGKLSSQVDNSQKVKCIQTGVIYNSLSEAAEKTGLSIASVSKIASGKKDKVRGLSFVKVK